jgi:hypothetical protein
MPSQPWNYALGSDSLLERFLMLDGKIPTRGNEHKERSPLSSFLAGKAFGFSSFIPALPSGNRNRRRLKAKISQN